MEIYTTANDQADAVRRFFSENIRVLVVSVVLGISVLIGWHYWQNHQNTTLKAASFSYQQVSEALFPRDKDLGDKKSIDKDHDVAAAEKFIQDNNNNYGVFIALELANYFVEQKAFDRAEQQLTLAVDQTKDENLLSLINLRIRGDLFLSKGDIVAARAAYTKGIESNASQALQVLLRLKLDDLSD
ncbi:YfgM family protein [Candidatus Fukatsuia endosymbiont of Tuberolachnus salignus]|uniref:YfgM family protein n=1 Tax=Candidatus Fukatsuia endosymbiont of Tuberolachnus salignus TaxID=3077957 RepID=UPI00313B9949